MRDADLAPCRPRGQTPMSALADLRGFAPNRRAAPDFEPNLERLKSTRDATGPLGLMLSRPKHADWTHLNKRTRR